MKLYRSSASWAAWEGPIDGENPGPQRFNLVVNLKTAHELGITLLNEIHFQRWCCPSVADHIWTIGELIEAATGPRPVGPFRVIDGGRTDREDAMVLVAILSLAAVVWITICAHQGVALLLEINDRLRASGPGAEDALQLRLHEPTVLISHIEWAVKE